jgi:hypothetical protein
MPSRKRPSLIQTKTSVRHTCDVANKKRRDGGENRGKQCHGTKNLEPSQLSRFSIAYLPLSKNQISSHVCLLSNTHFFVTFVISVFAAHRHNSSDRANFCMDRKAAVYPLKVALLREHNVRRFGRASRSQHSRCKRPSFALLAHRLKENHRLRTSMQNRFVMQSM